MSESWKVSLHGGHSGQFCKHAKGTLEETVLAAIEAGMKIYGLSEHAPRYFDRDVYDDEKAKGIGVSELADDFSAFCAESRRLQKKYADQIEILCGFETEFIDSETNSNILNLIDSEDFDYVIGSVHHVREIAVDETQEKFDALVKLCGSKEAVTLEYYKQVAQMVQQYKPDVVGHIDLTSKFGSSLRSAAVHRQMDETLQVIAEAGSILDLNVYPLRKGKKDPYPAPWIVVMAHARGIPFCFGDDSHSPNTVGEGLEVGRNYLLRLGIQDVAVPTATGKRVIALR